MRLIIILFSFTGRKKLLFLSFNSTLVYFNKIQ